MAEDPSAGSEAHVPEPGKDEAAPSRGRRRAVLAGAAAVLVLVGIGVGWLLSGRFALLPGAVPPTQHGALAMLEQRGDYDPGSVRYVGEKHDVAIWRATRDAGALECIAVTHEDAQGSGCRPVAQEEDPTAYAFGLSASIDFPRDDETVMVWASILPDISGEEVVIMQQQVMAEGDWLQGFTDAEVEDAHELEAEGFAPSQLSIVGYDGELALWQVSRDGAPCLAAVVDAEVHAECAEGHGPADLLRLRVGTTDYEVRQTPTHGQMLSIIRNATSAGSTVQPGERLTLGGEHGDPIEVTPDGPQG